MSSIFVNTDKSNPNDKLFNGKMAGPEAKVVEDLMQKVVIKIVRR